MDANARTASRHDHHANTHIKERLMKTHWIHGIAIALLGFALGMSDAHADPWPTPSIHCDESNAFTFTEVNYYDPVVRRNLVVTYWCDGMQWHAYRVCDPGRNAGCQIVIV